MISSYWKSISALLGAVAVLLASALTDDVISMAEAVTMVGAGLAAFGAYLVPNAPGYKYAKLVIYAFISGVNVLAGYVVAGEEITNAMWVNIAIVVAAGLGVLVLPNTQEPARPATADAPPV